jgi:hypothetical protein
MDTTSIGLMVTPPDDHVVQSVLDEMLQYLTGDGITMVNRCHPNTSEATPVTKQFGQTYFDSERPRTDPIVCLNVLTLFHSRGRGHELANTLEWVLGVLEHRAYLDGTRYYETAECFLFFSARLLHKVRDEALHARLARLLRERILERAGCTGDALALAMRVIVGAAVGLRLERDLAALLPLQYEDGGWGPSWIYKYGSSGIKIGNRGLTTALALKAIAALHSPQPQPPQTQTQPQHGQQRRKQKQKQEQKQEEKLELEFEKEEMEKKLPIGESFYRAERSPLPLPQLPATSVIRGSTSTGLSSSPSLPLLQMRRLRWKEAPSIAAFVKGAFTFLFSRPSRQA